MSVTNYEIRALMLRYGLSQQKLGEILGMGQPDVSRMLRYELSKAEKQRIRETVEKEVKS